MLLIVVPITLIPSSVLMGNGALSLTLIALPLALVDIAGGILDFPLPVGLVVRPITLGVVIKVQGGNSYRHIGSRRSMFGCRSRRG